MIDSDGETDGTKTETCKRRQIDKHGESDVTETDTCKWRHTNTQETGGDMQVETYIHRERDI